MSRLRPEPGRRADGAKRHFDALPSRLYRAPSARYAADEERPEWRRHLDEALAARGRSWGELLNEGRASGHYHRLVSSDAGPDLSPAGRHAVAPGVYRRHAEAAD